jgi:hypothetical protein
MTRRGWAKSIQFAGEKTRRLSVWLVIVEALLALALLVFIVWWTMFHGRRKPPPDN